MMLHTGLERPHPVETVFDERLDTNENGRVESFEIFRAKRAGNIEGGRNQHELQEFYPVVTIVDGAIDINDDRRVSRDEIETVIKLFVRMDKKTPLPDKLSDLFDINRDGEISTDEFKEGRILFIQAHPVDPDRQLDLRLDQDGDNFVGPHEIGIAAGVSPAGPAIPFEELIERFRWQEADSEHVENKDTDIEYEIVTRLEALRDKKLAVVGLNNQVDSLSKQTADGLIVFVENAFVNVGKVKVVDRQNISKIMDEQKFQLSGISDETTAVEIGKLAGADIIVIGSISYVGSKYYLNIKMIGVETAQILGSSISQASEDSGFLNMCNDAVYKLFLE